MTTIWGVSPTQGVLLSLRKQVEFLRKSKEILEMKRDRLAGEINKLLHLVKLRKEAEEKMMEAYKTFIECLLRKGYRDLSVYAKSVNYLRLKLSYKGVMGVNLIEASVDSPPNLNSIYDPLVQATAKKLYEAFIELLKVSEVENNVEILAKELMATSAKVNSLEKIVIPEYEDLIRYIEERLLEEALEDFVRIKFLVSKRGGGA